jgi:uncharacterized phage infection (PIP) family protein YhgE
VKKVNDIIAEIAAASTEQSAGIAQVNKAVSQMDTMVEQNSALVEQASAASEAMKEQAQTLKQQVAFFTMGEREEVVPTSHAPKHKPKAARPTPSSMSTSSKTVVNKQRQGTKQHGEWEDF